MVTDHPDKRSFGSASADTGLSFSVNEYMGPPWILGAIGMPSRRGSARSGSRPRAAGNKKPQQGDASFTLEKCEANCRGKADE